MNRILIFSLLSIANYMFSFSIAQTNKIELKESSIVQKLNSYFIEYNLKRNDYPGWRIQVFASTDRKEMETTLSRFRSQFPGYYAKWTLNDPYYQVKAGIFTDYGEAMKALQDVRRSFRSSTLITDRIRREEILSL